ncbi:hypothetical protein GCM10022226_39380 [Sphaerisporangium flaviroseum]|uniref:SGNH/GDSL hydrolase family protein n=1 Tax=Sphaerisporangium flaviroseum TaxID=509199 RepID=A0ABP7IBU8_9ACTN
MPADVDTRPRYRFFTVLTIGLAAFLFAGIGLWNYRLNPLAYDRSQLREVAGMLVQGQNYANYDTNINWRALRREQIYQMKATPDVVVFGGSRWWEAHADLFPGQRFFNAWVSNDQAEDALALAYMLDHAGRLPKTLILSLRFISFQPPAEREAAEWQEWSGEYRAMAARLGVAPHSYFDTMPVKNWSGLFYAPAVFERARQVAAAPEKPGPTTLMQKPSLEVIAADGSIHWSKKSLAKYTKKFVDGNVRKELLKIGDRAPKIDPALVDAMGKAIGFLRSKGVRVILVQTPYHPDFYTEIQKRPFGKTLNSLESIAQDMSRRWGVISVGGYDPARFGCVGADFIDQIHSKPSCLSKVVGLIPAKDKGV